MKKLFSKLCVQFSEFEGSNPELVQFSFFEPPMHTHNKNLQVEVEVQVEDSLKSRGSFVEDSWKLKLNPHTHISNSGI